MFRGRVGFRGLAVVLFTCVLTAAPFVHGGPYDYTARKLLTSLTVSSGAYAVSAGKQYGVRVARDTSGGYPTWKFNTTVWSGQTDSFVDLGAMPIEDALGRQFAGRNSGGATLWTSATTPVNLHPAGTQYAGTPDSIVYGLAPGVQVGRLYSRYSSTASRAVLWKGSGASIVDLHPPGFQMSGAVAAGGGQQVGYARKSWSEGSHAALWNGSSASFVDLHPAIPGYRETYASGVSRGRQVGGGTATRNNFTSEHALLWTGSASSMVDLNPTGFVSSRATDIVGDWVLGSGYHPTTGYHPLIWDLSTTPPTLIDLKPSLDAAGFIATPWAISSSGDIVGVTPMVKDPNAPGGYHNTAVLWRPTTPRVGGDANLDGAVNFADFQLLEANFGSIDSYWKAGDFNDDRQTTFEDFLLMRQNFGKVSATEGAALDSFAAAHVPEPGLLALVAAGAALLLRRPARPGLQRSKVPRLSSTA
jgi:hypothetical protein